MKKSSNHIDVLVIGRNCLDYISVVETFPVEDEKVPLEFRLVEGGGQGGTSACCVARLGGRVALIGKIGFDEEGGRCLDRLEDFGVDKRFVDTVQDGRTPVAYLFVTRGNGRRTIIYEPNQLPRIELSPEHLALLSNARTVLLDPETTYLAAAVKKHAGPDTRIIYDCERWKPGVEQMMALADYFIPAAVFLNSPALNCSHLEFYGKVLRLDQDVKGQLIVTKGEEGAFYPHGGQLYHVPSPDVKVVDTIGAGDNFHGAFALAVSRGLGLHQAVRFAVATATLSCRGYGGRQGLPDMREAELVSRQIKEAVVYTPG